MRKQLTILAAVTTAAGALTGVAVASGHKAASTAHNAAAASRLDDGKDLLPQAKITEAEAIVAAQGAASGALDEVDLEQSGGELVFNVDVGASDVKVDATSGKVVGRTNDD